MYNNFIYTHTRVGNISKCTYLDSKERNNYLQKLHRKVFLKENQLLQHKNRQRPSNDPEDK